MAGENSLNLFLDLLVLIRCLQYLLLIVKGTARQTSKFKQGGQRKVLP
jgi:hypothetical protein